MLEYDQPTLDRLHRVELSILKDLDETCRRHDIPFFLVYGSALGAVRHKGFIPWDDDVDVAMMREDFERFSEIMDQELGGRYELLTPERNERYTGLVTHFQLRGTRFVPYDTRELTCTLGIPVDIFVFDNVADDPKARRKQIKYAWFWGHMLYLYGIAHPEIPLTGFRKKLSQFICVMIHGVLRLFHISPRYLFRKYKSFAQKYKGQKTECVTFFEVTGAENCVIRRDDIFPLQTVEFEGMELKAPRKNHEYLTQLYGDYMQIPPVEKRKNHFPYILEFGSEE